MPSENIVARTSGERKQSTKKKSSSFKGNKRSSAKSSKRVDRSPGLGSRRNVKRSNQSQEENKDRSERTNASGGGSSQRDGNFKNKRKNSRGENSTAAPRHGRGSGSGRNSGGFKNHRGSTGGNSRGRSSNAGQGSRGGKGRFGAKSKAIDPALFVNEVVEVTQETEVEIKHSFADFKFDDRLTKNVSKKGYETPTPIQDQTIKFALEGRDIFGMANTGTGKTAAFVLPIVNNLLKMKGQQTSALIIAPVRELAQQINQEFKSFTGSMKLYSTLCVGGLSIHKQKVQLRRHPHVVVGTPGRLKDLYEQGVLDLDDISMFVLDEVDLMLDMGFIDDIRFLVSKIPDSRQTLCFSATMTDTIKRLLDTVMKEPVSVSVKTTDTSSNVDQDVVFVKSSNDKWNKLISMFDDNEFEKILIFCETKSFVQQLCEKLNEQQIRAEAIHGDKSQPQRQRALKKFKENQVQVLVATDVAARGLDIPNVSHVINYDAPRVYEDYVHRIGRTGRAGKLGKAITFVRSK